MLNGVSTSVFYHLISPLQSAGQRLVDILYVCTFRCCPTTGLSKADMAFSSRGLLHVCADIHQ